MFSGTHPVLVEPCAAYDPRQPAVDHLRRAEQRGGEDSRHHVIFFES